MDEALRGMTPRERTVYWIDRFHVALLEMDEGIGRVETLGQDAVILRAQRDALDSQLQTLLRELEEMGE